MYGHGLSVETGGTVLRGSTVRPRPEAACCVGGVRALPPAQARLAAAVHAAGHATVGRVLGLPAPELRLAAEPPCAACGAVEVRGHRRTDGRRAAGLPDLLVMLAAGTQAELLWLDRSGLFTEARAWSAEAAGLDDQEQAGRSARLAGAELVWERPGDAPWPWNYRLQELRAVRLLDQHWPELLRLAEALDAAGQLTAVETTRLLSWGG